MPPGVDHPGNVYHAVAYGDTVDVWWPFTFEGNPANRGSHYLEGIGRFKAGVTPGQAQAEMNLLVSQLDHEHPKTYTGWRVLVMPLYREIVGPSRAHASGVAGSGCPGAADRMRERRESAVGEGHSAGSVRSRSDRRWARRDRAWFARCLRRAC